MRRLERQVKGNLVAKEMLVKRWRIQIRGFDG
jgi:hypothetical protein